MEINKKLVVGEELDLKLKCGDIILKLPEGKNEFKVRFKDDSEKKLLVVGNDISDGYHTFNELYDHRCLLWILFLLRDGEAFVEDSFWVRDHFKGWDLLSCKRVVVDWGQIDETTVGEFQMTYHVPIKFRHLYEGKISEESRDYAEHVYDKHTSADVLKRLEDLCRKV